MLLRDEHPPEIITLGHYLGSSVSNTNHISYANCHVFHVYDYIYNYIYEQYYVKALALCQSIDIKSKKSYMFIYEFLYYYLLN